MYQREKLNRALDYAVRGWAVFPLSPLSKIPLISREKGGRCVHDATVDVKQITEWWKSWPTANVGIACGAPSGIVVIDIDPKNGGDKSVFALSQKGYVFEETATVLTPNAGRHMYYTYEPWVTNSSKILGVGIDVQSTGKPITAPPSRVRNLAGVLCEYAWDCEGEAFPTPAPLPSWMRKLFQPKPIPPMCDSSREHAGDVESLCRWMESLGEGSRNNALFWASATAANLVSRGKMSKGAAQAALLDSARRMGLSLQEAKPTIESGFAR